ncbi:LCP family protein [Allorhizocola rhizosphaerae]|uniref:LCP family protein n=1 Tax=Allorhizocola rhizosphaerae TaxID=1872709 RepID=UPI0013C2FD4C|nr:LCP family protein [Allorhizocola rhizosphaerae]
MRTEPYDTDGHVTPDHRRAERRRQREQKRRRKLRLWHKLTIGFGAALVLISAGSLIAIKTLTSHYEGLVAKEDMLGDIPMAPAPPAGESGPLNFLILGVDTRNEEEVADPEERGNRSDVIMIAHVSKDRRSAFIFSIPRDSFVTIPAGGTWKGGENKINSAMAFGGAKLAAKTVYDLTKIPLNGAVIVNFQGVQTMVGAVGGVRVCIPYQVNSTFSNKVWKKGCHDLSPADAEEFVRQRKGVSGGDLGRIKNQQHVIKGLIAKVKQGDTLTNPSKLNSLLTTAAQSLTIDKSMNLTQLALEMKDIDQEAIKFATTPVIGTMNTHAGSSVQLDMAGAQELFAAVRDDKTDEWLAAHPQPEVASL